MTFNLTGTYLGYVVCDSTVDGMSSTWGRPIAVSIAEINQNLQYQQTQARSFIAEFNYTDVQELGSEYTVYNGQYAFSPSGEIVNGYFDACGGTFPAKELGRIFPSTTTLDPFSMTVSSVWVSDDVPNLPGLYTQECKWSLTRNETEIPIQNRVCDVMEGDDRNLRGFKNYL